MTSKSNFIEKGTEEWRKNLVGKTWEIYWEPAEKPSNYEEVSENRVPSSPSTLLSTDDENSYIADWYDGHVKSYSSQQGTFEVVFVGEDTIYNMSLKPSSVRPLVSSDPTTEIQERIRIDNDLNRSKNEEIKRHNSVMESTLEWKQHLIGKTWEIYWDSRDSIFLDELQNFESDWYEGKVLSYSISDNTFQVSFIGEDYVHQMSLGPNVLRPSVMAWIRRTTFLLNVSHGALQSQSCDMPHSTATFDLLPAHQEVVEPNESGEKCIHDEDDEEQKLRQMIDEQIFLRDKLIIESDDVYSDNEIGSKVLMKSYVNHLTQCLDLVKEAFVWCQASSKYAEMSISNDIYSASSSNPDIEPQLQREATLPSMKIEVEDFYKHILFGLHIFIRVCSMKTDPHICTKKKRKRLELCHIPSIQPLHKNDKRRRIKLAPRFKQFSHHNGDEHVTLESILDTEVKFTLESNRFILKSIRPLLSLDKDDLFPSFHFFQKLMKVWNGTETRSRLYVQKVSRYLNSILCLVWDEVLRWMTNANNLLKCNKLPLLDDVYGAFEYNSNENSFTLEDVCKSLDYLRKHPIVSHFDLSIYENSLIGKRETIKAFESKVWSTIATCTNNVVQIPSINIEVDESKLKLFDDTTKNLHLLRDELRDVPSLSNIKSIGEISMELIDEAIKLRKWVIGFNRCMNSRERVALLSILYHEKPEIISMPAQFTQSNVISLARMSRQLDSTWIDFINKNQNNYFSQDSYDKYNDEKECRRILRTLRDTSKFLTECEEEFAIIADILLLKEKVTKCLGANIETKICYHDVQELFTELEEMKLGNSLTRKQLTASLLQNVEVNQRIQAFATRQLKSLLGDTQLAFYEVYEKGRNLKESSELLLKPFKSHGLMDFKYSQTKCTMVDIDRIESLVKEHEISPVTFPEIFHQLSKVYNDAKTWQTQLDSILTSAVDFCPYQVAIRLQDHSIHRPKGYVVVPYLYYLSLTSLYSQHSHCIICVEFLCNLQNIWWIY